MERKVYNAGQRKDVRQAEKDAKLADQQEREFITHLMSTTPGRRWMHNVLEQCHIFSTSYSRDSTTMAFNEGQRDIGLKLLNGVMAACPESYILMMREHNERRSTSERTRDQNSNGRDQGSDSFTDLYTDAGEIVGETS